MDWFPLLNSIRIAALSTVIVFFLGIFAAYFIAKAPRVIKGLLDVILTLPLVLPPTVVGYLLLLVLGPKRILGRWLLDTFGLRVTMAWQAGVFAAVAVSFPLMYRTARGAFESFDETLAHAGRTLGLSSTYIFWRVRMPVCRQGILAGTVLTFARALGEYGATSMLAGYTPGRTATISTAVYQLWRTGEDGLAFRWVLVNLSISAVVLQAVNLLNGREARADGADSGAGEETGGLPAGGQLYCRGGGDSGAAGGVGQRKERDAAVYRRGGASGPGPRGSGRHDPF